MAVSLAPPAPAAVFDPQAAPTDRSFEGTAADESRRLTPVEAEALWRLWKLERDTRARDRLVLAHAPLVKHLVSRKARELPGHCDLDDLASCGLIAILEAVERFDPDRGSSFEQYAWTRVSGAILDELRRQDRLSRPARAMARSAERTRERWYAHTGRQPTEAELAAELKITVPELRERAHEVDRGRPLSLNAPVGDEETREVGDTLGSDPGPDDPEWALLAHEKSAVFRRAIATLSEREREVLAMVHIQGLGGAEVGRALGVTESRVSQILASARRKLHSRVASYETL